MLKSQNVKLKPNRAMQHYLILQCNYRRFCWNQALALWDDMYEAHCLLKDNPLPNEYKVRNQLVHDKQDWQYTQSSRILQLSISDLTKAFKAFFNPEQPDAKHPKFYSKKRAHQSFKTDRAKIIDGKLRLDKPSMIDKNTFTDIKMRGLKKFNGDLKMINIKMVNHQFIATLFYKDHENQVTTYTNNRTAIDLNTGHFNYIDSKDLLKVTSKNVLSHKLQRLYLQNKYYQRLLARKRLANPRTYRDSHQYQNVLTKLNRNYLKITNIQNDMFHKLSHRLVTHFDHIVIEDLDVKHMMMTHVASKGMQRSGFGKFRQMLVYKCNWYGKHLIIADRYYPSTQLCSNCGFRKQGVEKITLSGNQKHHTNHHEYICYQCGFQCDRDENAVLNLLKLA